MEVFNPYNFIFEEPLYTVTTIYERAVYGDESIINNIKPFIELMNFRGTIEAYNPSLKQETTYKVVEYPGRNIAQQKIDDANSYTGIKQFQVKCVRDGYTIIVYIEIVQSYKEVGEEEFEHLAMRKIGQSPSVADLHVSRVKEYDNVLPRRVIREFTKAIGLAANGVGIGSFVYLRRIFEGLIEEAHQLALKDDNWNEDIFAKARVAEKIGILRDHLPDFLVEQKALYSILSKGIHELEENECLQFFDAIKLGIEQILDEKVARLIKAKKAEEAKLKIQVITQKLGGK